MNDLGKKTAQEVSVQEQHDKLSFKIDGSNVDIDYRTFLNRLDKNLQHDRRI